MIISLQLDHLQPNPNCNVAVCQAKENGVLIYQKAKGDKDEIHHLFCTIGAPTVCANIYQQSVIRPIIYIGCWK